MKTCGHRQIQNLLQIDLETSFSKSSHVQGIVWNKCLKKWSRPPGGLDMTEAFLPSMTYAHAMAQYGVDKPDTVLI